MESTIPRNKLIRPSTVSEGFTQSELDLWSTCHQKWNWQYNWRLQSPNQFSFALAVGSLWHEFLEQLYATAGMRWHIATLQFPEGYIPTVDNEAKKKYWDLVLPAMAEAYAIYYGDKIPTENVIHLEQELSYEYRGILLRGKIDKATDENGLVITDYKTASRIGREEIAGWEFRFQFMFYIWLYFKVHKVMPVAFRVDATKKPELRVKQSETLEGHADRVKQDMIINPDKYFFKTKDPVLPDAIKNFEKNILDHKINRIAAIVNPGTPVDIVRLLMEDKNTNECNRWGIPCSYIDLCRHGYDKMGQFYRVKSVKHEELNSDDII